jgi:UDP-N-acetylglucosamine acyltransferase
MHSQDFNNTAIVSEKAKIGKNVSIGPFSIIADDVEIGDNTIIESSVVIADGARIGKDCHIYTGAVIATEPQDLKFNGEKTYTFIGDRTVIREYVTINRGTKATGKVIVGEDCFIMAYCHIAHDCVIGNRVIMANTTQLGGHVQIQDWVVIGGVVKIHQFCKIGCHAMLGADIKIVKDVPPYTLVASLPPKIDGINKVGLKRRGFSKELIKEIDDFYLTILRSGMNNKDGIKKFLERPVVSAEIKACIKFIEESERGIYR